MSVQLERWTLTATELLAESARVFLHEPCPRCGHSFTYRRDSDGAAVRVRTLRVSETGCTCQGCGAFGYIDESDRTAREHVAASVEAGADEPGAIQRRHSGGAATWHWFGR